MMAPRREAQAALFYAFSLEEHVLQDHLLRSLDRHLDPSSVRGHLADYDRHTGRPSVDPELMIRMLLVGYGFGIRSERRLCEEVHLNLAYRWFCCLDLTDRIPDHSRFSKNRHGRFRESDLLRHVFEATVARCMEEGLVSGQGFAVDASLIHCPAGDLAKPNRPRGGPMSSSRTPALPRIVRPARSITRNTRLPATRRKQIRTFKSKKSQSDSSNKNARSESFSTKSVL